MCYYKGNIYLSGGTTGYIYYTDLYRYSLVEKKMYKIQTTGEEIPGR